MSKSSLLRRLLAGAWHTVTRVRQALANLLFLGLLAFLLYLLLGGEGPEPVPAQAALLLNPAGTVVDQKSWVDPLSAVLAETSPADGEVLLQDIIDAIDYAREDPRINSLVLELDQLLAVGISKTLEISRALATFRESGKPVVAVGDYFTQDQYLLASQADTVLMHPFGGVALEGFSSYRNYYREALENLSVRMHVFKAGDHKSIAEPFLRDDMSEGERKITARWLQQLWERYTTLVEQRRGLPAGAVDEYINDYAARVARVGGDIGRTALEAKLVDRLVPRQEANEYLVELVGGSDEEGYYQAVPFDSYVARHRRLHLAGGSEPRVAVITAEGDIVPGEQPPGAIGGDTLARLLRDTAAEDDVAAIVLRINSGGGSVFASEVIRQQLQRVRAQGTPVVVSMGAVAASGGYYIAAQADQIWATPATITGSIGVFAAFPTVEELLAEVGIHTDGVGTTELAGALRLDRPLNEQLAATLSSSVQFSYRQFLALVAEGRDMSTEEVDAVAQGRVWSAADARDRGLVDELGHLQDAVAAAGKLAGLSDYRVDYIGPVLSPRDQLMQRLLQGAARWHWPGQAGVGNLARLLQPLRAAVDGLARLDDPGHLYMRCLGCGVSL